MTRWLVTLTGTEADLGRLVELPDGDDWQIIRHDKRGVVLCGQRFEVLTGYAAVGEAAEALIVGINRAATFVLPGFQGVHCGHTVEQRRERDHAIVRVGLAVETSAAARVGWVKLAPDGTVIESSEDREREQQAQDYAKLVMLLEAHPDLADALRYLEDEPNMPGYYKAAEAIRDAVSGKWNTIVSLGWTTDAELRRFRQSTQPRRHHKGRAPDSSFTEAQADTYVRGLLDKLIKHLHRTGP